MSLDKILIENRIPVEIINYIYTFDDTKTKEYKYFLNKLENLIEEYTQLYQNNVRVIRYSFHDEVCYPGLEYEIKWYEKFGTEFKPSKYILSNLKSSAS